MSRHDISDEKWEIIAPLLARKPKDPRGRPPKDKRMMFNAILWIIKTGAPCAIYQMNLGLGKQFTNALPCGLNWQSGMTS